ncbi:hypothetical protein SETIT_1G225700v2 [Setaria italica]|uniref:BED-type domain-containing protein n=1 Tax=Setaria italica TaxID=4555 RepID=A0A368PQC1_SETIT|nr:hypothetical protein SETIT_1G225700v2 [Setaria italica]
MLLLHHHRTVDLDFKCKQLGLLVLLLVHVLASGSAALASDSSTTPSNFAAPGTEDVIEIEDNVAVGSKRKLKSEVWKEFDRIKLNGNWKAKCIWCKKMLGETRNGTNHLHEHLEICQDRASEGLRESQTITSSRTWVSARDRERAAARSNMTRT